MILEEIDIGYKELITIEALKSLNDIELEMFIRIYKTVDLTKTNKIQEIEELKAFHIFCIRTVEKLKNLQVLEEEESGRFDSKKTGYGTFISSEIAEDLFYLIERLGIDSLALKRK